MAHVLGRWPEILGRSEERSVHVCGGRVTSSSSSQVSRELQDGKWGSEVSGCRNYAHDLTSGNPRKKRSFEALESDSRSDAAKNGCWEGTEYDEWADNGGGRRMGEGEGEREREREGRSINRWMVMIAYKLARGGGLLNCSSRMAWRVV